MLLCRKLRRRRYKIPAQLMDIVIPAVPHLAIMQTFQVFKTWKV